MIGVVLGINNLVELGYNNIEVLNNLNLIIFKFYRLKVTFKGSINREGL